MTGNEFTRVQDSLGFFSAGLARLLKVHPNTVTKWRTGKAKVPGPVGVCMRLLVEARNYHNRIFTE